MDEPTYGYFIMFHWSVSLSLCKSHTVLITIALYQVLPSDGIYFVDVFSIFKCVWTLLSPLHFHIRFRTCWSITTHGHKSLQGLWECRDLQISCRTINIYKIKLPIYEAAYLSPFTTVSCDFLEQWFIVSDIGFARTGFFC